MNPNKIGCRICKSGFYLDIRDKEGSPGVKMGVCQAGKMMNCVYYENLMSGDTSKCIACDVGFNLTSQAVCVNGSTISNCMHMGYDQASSKSVCFVCKLGYGLSVDKLSCVKNSPTISCLNGLSTEDKTCTSCSIYSGYFSVGIKNDDEAK